MAPIIKEDIQVLSVEQKVDILGLVYPQKWRRKGNV